MSIMAAPVFRLPRVCCVVLLLLVCGRVAAREFAPLEVVRDTSARMLVAQDSGRCDEPFAGIVLPNPDFRRMSQLVPGRNGRAATEQQRERFVEPFRALPEYPDETVVYLPFDAGRAADRVTVRTGIDRRGGTSLPIPCSMCLTGSGLQVHAVPISGVNVDTSNRSRFGNTVRKDGMDSRIAQLRDRKHGARDA
jgi:phospholipid transport system substrate-binding protein